MLRNFAGLRMPHPDGVSHLQTLGRTPPQRGLDLARAFEPYIAQ